MRTVPSGAENVAPTGQTFTQGGFWHCWQGAGMNCVPPPGRSPFEHLDPLHGLRGEVALDAGRGALGWLAHALTAITVAQVDDHPPLSNAAVGGACRIGI